jgi:hypothetical protein
MSDVNQDVLFLICNVNWDVLFLICNVNWAVLLVIYDGSTKVRFCDVNLVVSSMIYNVNWAVLFVIYDGNTKVTFFLSERLHTRIILTIVCTYMLVTNYHYICTTQLAKTKPSFKWAIYTTMSISCSTYVGYRLVIH